MAARLRIDADETPLFVAYVALPMKVGTAAGGQFGWGGTPLKVYQRCPMVGSDGSEIRC